MHKYQIFIDASHSWDDGNIEVVEIIVEADNADAAYHQAIKELTDGKHDKVIAGREYYVWSVTEMDRIAE